MTIASAIENARNKIATAYQTVESMGGTLPATQNLENLPTAIESVITTGPLIDGSVTEVDTSVSSIRGSAFANCTSLNTVILRSNTVVDLSDDTIFENTPIASKTGNIFVLDGLVNNYKSNKVLKKNQEQKITSYNTYSITYGNGKFLIAGANGNVFISSDGLNWEQKYISSSGSTYWTGATYNSTNSLFVVCGINSTDGRICYSSDLNTWTEKLFASRAWKGISSYNNFALVVDGNGYSAFADLSDPLTWTTYKYYSGYNGACSVCFDNQSFAYVGIDYGYVEKLMYNDLSGHYESIASYQVFEDSGQVKGIIYANDRLIACCENHIGLSFDRGSTWNVYTVGDNNTSWNSISYGNGIFIVCGGEGKIALSSDGSTWNVRTIGSQTLVSNTFDYNNNLFMMCSGDGYDISLKFLDYNFLPISQLPTQ